VSGVEMIADVIGLEEKIKKADCVITGEGSFDSQSFSGKAVGYMIERSAHFERPLLIACGVNKNPENKNIYSLVDIASDGDSAMKESQHWLVQLGRQMALDWKD
jgi:glycerate kinase